MEVGPTSWPAATPPSWRPSAGLLRSLGYPRLETRQTNHATTEAGTISDSDLGGVGNPDPQDERRALKAQADQPSIGPA
jgi:hypothetical protein